MKKVRKIIKSVSYFLIVPSTYLILSLILSAITVNREKNHEETNRSIFLSSNGVHLDIVIPRENIDPSLLTGLQYKQNEKYLSFAWGDKNFYLNTPTWSDLTFKNAFTAMFLPSPTLVHVMRYETLRSDWIKIKINDSQLKKLNTYIVNTFSLKNNGEKIILKNQGYTHKDNFYKAKGKYSLFKTSNSWVNTGFKKSGLKSCLWTPFDFALMNKYR